MPILPIALVFDASQAFTRGVLRGIEHFAQTRPRWALLFHDFHSLTPRAIRELHPAGLIAHVVNPALAKVLQSLPGPVVNTSFMCPEAKFPRVTVDNREVGRMGFRHLHERGFRNFGLVGHGQHLYSTEREAGFCEELDDEQHTYAGFYRKSDQYGSAPGAALAETSSLNRWLRKLPKPAGILTCRGVWGVQVVEACRLLQLRVPEDIGVVCVDDDDLLCELSRPSLTSILVPSESIGFEAAAVLDRLLQSRNSTTTRRRGSRDNAGRSRSAPRDVPDRLVVPTRFIPRQSSDVCAGSSPELSAAMQYIRNHAHEGIHVDDVAQASGISRRALESQFRETLQRGVGEEIRRIRLSRAEQYLTSTDMSVGEIAAQSGFSSVYYLSRYFRQQTGLTPSDFRKTRRRISH